MEDVKVEKNYNLKDVAYILGIKLRTAREWVHNGKLKAKKYVNVTSGKSGRCWYVTESELERIKNEME